MPIIRESNHKRDFVICDNTPIKDPALSAKAKGVLVVMLHLPDDWVFTEDGLTKFFADGKASIRSALGELENAGYLERKHPQRRDGTFSPWVWTVREKPLFDFEKLDAPLCDLPLLENRKVDDAGYNPRSQKNNPRSQPLCDLPLLENRKLQSKKEQSKKPRKNKLSGKPDFAPIVGAVVGYLNDKTGRSYKPSAKATARHINARVAEGFTVDDFKLVIDFKADQWLDDPSMSEYLRPETLFGTKFESYLQAAQSAKKSEADLDYWKRKYD